jgi:hypothetical protein
MEVVAMGCSYEYLPVPAPEARRAWYGFHFKHPRTPEPESVTFIPALGGSFVVLTEEERRSWAEALRPVIAPLVGEETGPVLQRFRRYLVGS